MELAIRFQRDLIDKSNEVDYLLSGDSGDTIPSIHGIWVQYVHR